MAHPQEDNTAIGMVFLAIGWLTRWVHEIENLNIFLDFGLKITSYISFALFIVINWVKIKAFFKKQIDEKSN